MSYTIIPYGDWGLSIISPAPSGIGPILGWPDLPLNDNLPVPAVGSDSNSFLNDWVHEDGIIQEVIYTPCTLTGFGTPITLQYLITRPISDEEVQNSFGVYRRKVCTAQIPSAYISITPRSRDTLVISGITFQVAKVLAQPYLGSPWALELNYIYIDTAVADTISWVQPHDSTDAFLSPLTTAGTTTTGLACRIQFDKQIPNCDFQGLQYHRPIFNVFAPFNTILKVGTVLNVTGGKYTGATLTVEQNLHIEELDEMQHIVCGMDPLPNNNKWI